MPRAGKRAAPAEPARERILAAAIGRFGTQSYEATGLRDIAADAGVDVAYVHRSFGSKEALFAAAMRAVMQDADFETDGLEALARRFAEAGLERRRPGETRPMDMVARSFSSPEAAGTIRELLMEDFVRPLRASVPQVSERDAALAAAILCGVMIMRDVVAAPPLTEAEPEAMNDQLARIISLVLAGDRA